MSHSPIQLQQLSLTFPHKICFEDFSASIFPGQRIAVIGRNGSGKSMLLRALAGFSTLIDGEIKIPEGLCIAHVPQIISGEDPSSGAERFHAALTQALALDPDVLLLDEPTNHLDRSNRKSLMRMLRKFQGTLVVVSHDPELLRTCVDTLWHIDQGEIHIFNGHYEDYLAEKKRQEKLLEEEKSSLDREKKSMHQSLMREQARASKSRQKGEKNIDRRKWPTVVSHAKAGRASATAGNKKAQLEAKKSSVNERLSELYIAEKIQPKFSITAADLGEKNLILIQDARLAYLPDQPILLVPNFSLSSKSRVAICGDNASGKTTFIKAILGFSEVIKTGEWFLPKREDIGYLDQHYQTLTEEKTVLETLRELVPTWPQPELRKHLNDFLFRKNEEVEAKVSSLSGGERARLILALIAAKTPKLLILDEVTNNIDLETREHLIEVLKEYPGAMLVISHEEDFLNAIGVGEVFEIQEGLLSARAINPL